MAAPQSTPLPEAPTRGEAEGQFVPKANAFVGALEPLRQQLQAQADFVNERSTETEENAALARDAAEMALSSANFAGDWSDLSGAFDVPTSVLHDDTYWQLLEDVSNIQDDEPGVSDAWAPINVARNVVLALPDITSLSSLNTAALVDGQQVSVGEFWPGTGVGGGTLTWRPEEPKANHNGGTIIDPDKLGDLGDIGEFNDYFTPAGSGVGCWISSKRDLHPSNFGAPLDGENDDTAALRAYHEYCNLSGQKAKYNAVSSFTVQADAQIHINSDVDFCNAKINIIGGMVDSPDYSIERNRAFVIYDPDSPRVSGSLSDINGDNFEAGSFEYPSDLIPGPGFVSFFLNSGSESLPVISNRLATGHISWRSCAKVYSDLTAQYPMPVDASGVTDIFRVYRLDSKRRLKIGRVSCDCSQFNNQTLFRIERNGVTVHGLTVVASADIPSSVNDLVSPYECSDFILRGVRGPSFRNNQSLGTYYFRPTFVANYLVEDCDIRFTGSSNWSWMASGWCNGARFERSKINRVDIHEYSQNYFVDRCELFDRGFSVGQGGGIISVKNSVHYQFNRNTGVVGSRPDYGGSFDGVIEVDNITVVSRSFGGSEGIIVVDWERNPIGNDSVVQTMPYEIRVTNIKLHSPVTDAWRGIKPVSFRVKPDCAGVHAPSQITVDNLTSGQDFRSGVELDLHNCLRPFLQDRCIISISNIANRSRSFSRPTFSTISESGAPRQNYRIELTLNNVERAVLSALGPASSSSAKINGGSVCRGDFSNLFSVQYSDTNFIEPVLVDQETRAPLCASAFGDRFSTVCGGSLLGAFNFFNFTGLSGIASTSDSASGSLYPNGVTRDQLHSGWLSD